MIPTLYLSNWASKDLHGSGPKWSIMARPRAWEQGMGTVRVLTPAVDDLLALKALRLDWPTYRARFLAGLPPAAQLAPLALQAHARIHTRFACQDVPVADGDSLLCACSKADAAKGHCHRVFCAEVLQAAGWQVVLDGRVLSLGAGRVS